ncbi:MAG: hypothetical protein US75_C0007G0076 [Candidatus Woesebacteria bacterium GW2011_GWC1_38_13]|uniref:Type IV pilus assembly protein PilO n=2 Tax=Candidatus Woeseibacteriota TaxID=1752722 RepID=A0A0G0NDP1_9BACT|nr:MAG: hypothetical protein US75_C0007G0076 [Candidatus Woesebacteria bacterium GW2011_GWC1_38_13]KKQ76431.1 MAG: hypothetical protein US97_C0008G0007 [Microgenomates group bacterium GW2011_GWF1_38_5]KKQ84024.1 MAG: hypothetical protein UT06_C0011G0013 [Candidatus Woesebacteria bacterium GW2011_GWA1_38_8]
MLNKNTAVSKMETKTSQMKTVMPEGTKKIKGTTKIKSWVMLIILDIILFSISLYFIVNLPKKAEELNKVRSDEQKVVESKKIDVTGLEHIPTKESVDKLSTYFPEEAGIINFIERLERLREEGYIKNFSLVGQNAVQDKTSFYGLPFIIEFEGSWENVEVSLQEFQKLPYLVRAINVEVKTLDENRISFKYGGFLYVSEKLAKTR